MRGPRTSSTSLSMSSSSVHLVDEDVGIVLDLRELVVPSVDLVVTVDVRKVGLSLEYFINLFVLLMLN